MLIVRECCVTPDRRTDKGASQLAAGATDVIVINWLDGGLLLYFSRLAEKGEIWITSTKVNSSLGSAPTAEELGERN